MIMISEEQFVRVSQKHFFLKVSSFLLSHSQHEKMLAVLSDTSLTESLWLPVWDAFPDHGEGRLAVLFTYIMACYCEGENPPESLYAALDKDDSGLFMQRYYSDHGYIRFCALEFDFSQEYS